MKCKADAGQKKGKGFLEKPGPFHFKHLPPAASGVKSESWPRSYTLEQDKEQDVMINLNSSKHKTHIIIKVASLLIATYDSRLGAASLVRRSES